MGVPQLDSCCCGCSLKTGTKIIGWISLVMSVIMVIILGSGLAALYYIEDHPDQSTPASKEIMDHLPALKALTMFMIAVHVLGGILGFILLLGAYQNKANYVLLWVIVALTSVIIEVALNLVQMIAMYQSTNFLTLITSLVDVYFILVVYSFYREIRNVSTGYA